MVMEDSIGSVVVCRNVPLMAVVLPVGVKLAVIVALPFFKPCADPEVPTVASEVSALDHVTELVRSFVLPSLK